MTQPWSAQWRWSARISPWNERSGRICAGRSLLIVRLNATRAAAGLGEDYRPGLRGSRTAGLLFWPIDAGVGVASQRRTIRIADGMRPGGIEFGIDAARFLDQPLPHDGCADCSHDPHDHRRHRLPLTIRNAPTARVPPRRK